MKGVKCPYVEQRWRVYRPAFTALAAQPDAQSITQFVPRSSTEERPQNGITYLIRLSFETQLEHLRPSPVFLTHLITAYASAHPLPALEPTQAPSARSLVHRKAQLGAKNHTMYLRNATVLAPPDGRAPMPGLASTVVRWGTAVECTLPVPATR